MAAQQQFQPRLLLLSVPVGVVAVMLFSFLSGSSFGGGPFPVLAVLMGYVITGMMVGVMSEGETILEPGLASIAVAVITYFLIPAMGLRGYSDFSPEDDLVTMMNGILFTFVGALAGEKMQGTLEDGMDQKIVEWDWVFTGCMVGVTTTFTVVSVFSYFLGYQEWVHFVSFMLGLFTTGYIVGFRSPGKTLTESALAGLITVIICIDFVFVTIITFEISYILLSLAVGVTASLLGGVLGEKMQTKTAKA